MAAPELMNFNLPCITTLYDIDFSSHQPSSELQSSPRPSLQGAFSAPAAQSPSLVSPAALNSPPVQSLCASAQDQNLESPSTDLPVPPAPSAMETNVGSATVAESVQARDIGPAPGTPDFKQPETVACNTGPSVDRAPHASPAWSQPANGPAILQGMRSVPAPQQENALAPQAEVASVSELCTCRVGLRSSSTQSGQAHSVMLQARGDDLAAGVGRSSNAVLAPGEGRSP